MNFFSRELVADRAEGGHGGVKIDLGAACVGVFLLLDFALFAAFLLFLLFIQTGKFALALAERSEGSTCDGSLLSVEGKCTARDAQAKNRPPPANASLASSIIVAGILRSSPDLHPRPSTHSIPPSRCRRSKASP
jgi:hypothetical protein